MKHYFKKQPKKVKPPIGRDISRGVASKGNAFLHASTKGDTRTWNEALSHSSTGDVFVDDFAHSGAYRERTDDEIASTMGLLWSADKSKALRLALYLRMITRKTTGPFEMETVQKGQGNRDESLRRLLWIANNDSNVFHKNLWLYPAIGSWKDLWTLMGIDSLNTINTLAVFEVFKQGLNNDSTKDLVIKYMPAIRASSKCKTDRAIVLNDLAKKFAKYLGITQVEYRKIKAGGLAHIFQQQISKGLYDQIDFKRIPGKALLSMVSSKFLVNQGLDKKYEDWIISQPVAKFNGYPYELLAKVPKGSCKILQLPMYVQHTINKQFDGLIQKAKLDKGAIKGNVWCAIDTSDSMNQRVSGKNTAFEVCVSLGIYFSSLNEGAFKDSVIMFDNTSKKLQLGGTFIDKATQITEATTAWGSTNFQSVIDEIVRIRQSNPNIPIEDYPETLLVVSDMQFNPSTSGEWNSGWNINYNKTNYESTMVKLRAVGLPAINIIWWQVNGSVKDVPSRTDDKGTVVISGFDGAIITAILGGEQREKKELDMTDVFNDAISQPLLLQAKL